ncbi:MAG: flavin reductase family protein [Candidatus Hermodarchaeota archaeon]
MSENRKEIAPYDYIEYFERNTALMVTMDKGEKLNVMALDWKKLFDYKGKPTIRVQVAYSRYTYTCVTEGEKEFTINIPSDKISDAIDIAGSYSGRSKNKIKMAGLEVIPSRTTKVPTLKHCLLNYECKIIYNEKSNMSSHHYFYGNILAAYASNEIKN